MVATGLGYLAVLACLVLAWDCVAWPSGAVPRWALRPFQGRFHQTRSWLEFQLMNAVIRIETSSPGSSTPSLAT